MNRSNARWTLGLAICVAVIATSVLTAADQPAARKSAEDECVKKCSDCRASCLACVDHCLGKTGEEDCIRACLDCADICNACASVSARKGAMAPVIAKACAEACEKCAATCARDGDAVQKACAEKCRACSAACKAEAGG